MSRHVPILVNPIVHALLEPLKRLSGEAPPQWIVDCTLGGGGHTQAILDALESDPGLRAHRVLALDQDPSAVDAGRARFASEIARGRIEVSHSRFGEAEPLLEGRIVVGLMADLGFSSDQIEDSERGLSFQSDGPLDMRLDPSRGRSCRDILLTIRPPDLEEVLSEYGEERFARRIAGAIIESRREKLLPSTPRGLAELVTRAVPAAARHHTQIHVATRTFQALRILVNDELNELDSLLERVMLSVRPGGRVAVLSFHSLEDRRVKVAFKRPPFEPLTKKPLEADDEEIRRNPRSRSAKLRIAERQTD